MTGAAPTATSLPYAQRLIRGSGWVLLARAWALPVVLLQAMLLARLVTQAELGAYFLAISLVGLLAALAQVGMPRTMVKLVASARAADRPQAARHAIRVAVALTLVVGTVVALALADGPGHWLVATLADGGLLRQVLPLIALLVLAFALVELGAETLRGFQDLRGASLLADMLLQRTLVVVFLGSCWLLAWPVDLRQVLGLALAAAVLALLVAATALGRHLARLGRHGSPWPTGEILRHGPPFVLIRLNRWVLAGADIWVLGMFRPAEEVALYGAASRIVLLAATPLVVCNAVLAPTIAELYSGGQIERLERVLRTAATMATLPSLLVVLLFVLVGDRLLALLFTDAYRAAYPALVCLALGQFVGVACGSCATALTMTGHQRAVMVAITAAAGLTIAGLYLAAPHGALAVAAVVSASLALSNAAIALIARRQLGIRTWTTLSPDAFRRFVHELRRTLGRPA